MISREAQLGNKAIKFISRTGQLTSNQSGSGVSQAKARGPELAWQRVLIWATGWVCKM